MHKERDELFCDESNSCIFFRGGGGGGGGGWEGTGHNSFSYLFGIQLHPPQSLGHILLDSGRSRSHVDAMACRRKACNSQACTWYTSSVGPT